MGKEIQKICRITNKDVCEKIDSQFLQKRSFRFQKLNILNKINPSEWIQKMDSENSVQKIFKNMKKRCLCNFR